MIPIFQQKLVQIEITNACVKQCANCTRFVGHHRTPFFMTKTTFEMALDSLEGWPGQVGIMGGEPTMHPLFTEFCALLSQKFPKEQRELWTTGYKWQEYEKVILDTFDRERISYNEHSTDDGKHTPMLCAVKDLVDDAGIQMQLIDNCWVQPRWSSSITPLGCYFCEVAAALDIMLEGGHGWAIEKNWWNKFPDQFQDQVQAICFNCGAMLPIGETSDRATYDLISPSNLQKLKKLKSPKILCGNYALYKKKWTLEEIEKKKEHWKPYNWRNFYAHGPEDYQGKIKT